MITGPRSQFEARCRQRGYTLAEVAACIVAEDGDTITVDETHPAYPRASRPGLGDMVADGLAAVGITKQLVQSVTGRPCHCPERQAALNRLGQMVGLPPGRGVSG
jgi:hypothetical protein